MKKRLATLAALAAFLCVPAMGQNLLKERSGEGPATLAVRGLARG